MKPTRGLQGWGWVAVVILALSGSAAAQTGYGKLAGVVQDPSGTPQMGATVWVMAEDAGVQTASRYLTDQRGAFSSGHLKAGKYEVRVSLAGFLPALERDVAVAANLTTLLRVQMDSIFASLDQLRRKSDVPAAADDWTWVLRSSAATRTILQWRDGDVDVAENAPSKESPRVLRPRGRLEMTSGSVRPGSPSNLSPSPATAVSYDQSLGSMGRLLLAGQMSYEHGASGAFASVWSSGPAGEGPETTFVMRQAKIGVGALSFQGMRLDNTQQLTLSDRLSLRAGAEYLRMGILTSVSAVRPHAQLNAALAPGWSATFLITSDPDDVPLGQTNALESAIAKLDSLPTVLFRGGQPVLEGDWHEEFSVDHKVTDRARVEAAAFRDSTRHQAIFGAGATTDSDFFQDAFSSSFLYDGGASKAWGARLAFRQKFSDDLELAALYSWAGGLTPQGQLDTTSADLREDFLTRHHHSLGARISGKIPRARTELGASYQWASGSELTRMDPYGGRAYQIDPNLHLTFRQPLPGFGLRSKWEALADFGNLLAQGYVPVNGQDSRIVLVPVLRSFRGGVSFQF
jgi:hypothetical protein